MVKAKPSIQIMNDIDRASRLPLSEAKAEMRSVYLSAQVEIGKDAALDCLLTCLFVARRSSGAAETA